MNKRLLLIRWTLGVLLGTLFIAVVSPRFVRSYQRKVFDPIRGVWVAPEGSVVRWRSEGYADSIVGQHGMIGRRFLPAPGTEIIALWGDSQAEGVCVADDEKLHCQLETRLAQTGQEIAVVPLAGSGQDAWDWINQMPRVEEHLGVTEHLVLLSDWNDLLVLADDRAVATTGADKGNAVWLDLLPDFVIHAGRNLLLDEENRLRKLRWKIGPVASVSWTPAVETPDRTPQIIDSIERLRFATELPITILHAPQRPTLMGDHILTDDPSPRWTETAKAACRNHGILWIDGGEALIETLPDFPHGFHNGRPGSGHLNARGYRALAAKFDAGRKQFLSDIP